MRGFEKQVTVFVRKILAIDSKARQTFVTPAAPRFLLKMSELLNITTHDGSRHFADLPETAGWNKLRKHISRLDGAVVTNLLTDQITEVWIDFTFAGHSFSVNNQFGDYWFFVDNPQCPDDTLHTVLRHCESLLGTR